MDELLGASNYAPSGRSTPEVSKRCLPSCITRRTVITAGRQSIVGSDQPFHGHHALFDLLTTARGAGAARA